MSATNPGHAAPILPPIPSPHRYAGLYVYDFGGHVSVGYTAREIQVLRESPAHRDGQAYEIYRVDDRGAIELRGVLNDRLTAREAICFLRQDPHHARRDFDRIRTINEAFPFPCPVELQLARTGSFDPPNLTSLTFASASSTAVSRWLAQHAADLGDRVEGGINVCSQLGSTRTDRLDGCRLSAERGLDDRPADEVLRTTHLPIQRLGRVLDGHSETAGG